MRGTWVNRITQSSTTPPCCTIGYGYPLLRKLQVLAPQRYNETQNENHSAWCRVFLNTHVNRVSRRYTNVWSDQTYSSKNACSCTHFVERFEWKPTRCHPLEWNASHFCELLKGQPILFVGDSTMAQTASAVATRIQWDLWRIWSAGGGVGQPPSDCTRSLSFVKSDTLTGVKYGSMNRGPRWEEPALQLRAKVVVLSAGPHVGSKSNISALLHTVNQTIGRLSSQLAGLHVLWKTQPPAGCADTPLTEPMNSSSWQDYRKRSSEAVYNWPLFKSFDYMAKRMWEGHSQVSMLDVSPLQFRADAHISSPGASIPVRVWARKAAKDCLHMCMPGPYDTLVPTLLQHALMRRASGLSQH